MVSSERSSSDLTEYIFYFKLEKYYFIYKNNFIDEKSFFFAFFFKLLSKFRSTLKEIARQNLHFFTWKWVVVNDFFFLYRIYSVRSELDLSDETIIIQNFLLSRKLWWKNFVPSKFGIVQSLGTKCFLAS